MSWAGVDMPHTSPPLPRKLIQKIKKSRVKGNK
jgi:hypothetical protein